MLTEENIAPLEVVDCAIKTVSGDIISLPRPARHSHVIAHMYSLGFSKETILQAEQGFTTNFASWVFVSRNAALLIAKKANQLKRLPEHEGLIELYSEDLW